MPMKSNREPNDANAFWRAEVMRPISDRQIFSFRQIALKLARLPGRLKVDQDEAYRVLHELIAWYERQEFAEDEVLVIVDDPPRFVPLKPRFDEMEREYRAECRPMLQFWQDAVMLTRAALKRYLERSTLEGAPRLLQEWFFSDAATPAMRTIPKRPIPKPDLMVYLKAIKKEGGPPPAADLLVAKIRSDFPNHHVTRDDVRKVHQEVFDKLPPGKRSKPS
jgi:hypothetical protein